MAAINVKASVSALALGVAMASGSALAYEQGDIVARAGIAVVDPDASSSVLTHSALGPLPGTSVDVDDNTQLGLTFLYMLSSDVGIELLAATPFSHTVTAKGLDGLGLGLPASLDVADIKHLPPTVSIQYFPMDSTSAFQPYVGLGLNYTVFFDEELTSEFEGALGTGKIKLDDSFGLAFQLGCDYAVSDQLVINAAIWNIDIDTSATIKFDAGGNIKTDVDVDPWAYMVGVGYKF